MSATSKRESWKRSANANTTSNEGRWFQRIMLTIFSFGMIAVLVFIVYSLLLQPRVHLACLPAIDYRVLHAPPLTYIEEDLDAFTPLRDVLYATGERSGPLRLDNLQTSSSITQLAQNLQGLVTRNRDVLLLYVSMHGISEDGTAYVLCSDHDSANRDIGRYKLQDLLKQVQQCQAQTKVVLLDAGRIEYLPHEGMLLNEFPALLQAEIEQLNDPTLWVLCSHDLLQRSQVAYPEQHSVFGEMVGRALTGQADLDDDGEITLSEVHRFVGHHVAQWVDDNTGGRQAQTPRLWWAGQGNLPDTAQLKLLPKMSASVAATNLPPKPAGTAETTGEATPAGTKAAARRNPINLWSRRSSLALFQPGLQPPPPPPAVTAAPAATPATTTPAPASTAAPAGTAPAPASTAAPQATVEATKPAAPPKRTVSSGVKLPPNVKIDPNSAAGMLLQGWQLRDRLVSRAPGEWAPVDTAPHLMREFQDLLLGFERLERAGKAYQNRRVAELVKTNILAFERLEQGLEQMQAAGETTVAQRLFRARPRAWSDDVKPRSLAMAGILYDPATRTLPPDLFAVNRDLNDKLQGLSNQFVEWTGPKGNLQRFDRLAEIHLAEQLGKAFGSQYWETVRLTLETRQLAEEIAASETAALAWISLADIEHARVESERELFESEGQRQAPVAAKLQLARKKYVEAAGTIQLIRNARAIKNDLTFWAPDFLRYYASVGSAAPGSCPTHADLVALLEQLQAMTAALEAREPSQLPNLTQQLAGLQELRTKINSKLRDVVTEVCKTPNTGGNGWLIEMLLETGLPTAEERARLWTAAKEVKPLAPRLQAADMASPVAAVPPGRESWDHLVRRAELEFLQAQLAGDTLLRTQQEELTRAWAELKKAHQEWKPVSLATTVTNGTVDPLAAAFRKFGTTVWQFYRELPRQLNQKLTLEMSLVRRERDQRRRQLEVLERLLRVVAAEQISLIPPFSALEQLQQDEWFDLLVWQQERALAARDQGAWDAEFLSQAAIDYRLQATALPRQPVPPKIAELQQITIAFTGEPAVSVPAVSDVVKATVTAEPRGPLPSVAWLFLDYDSQLLNVVQTAGPRAVHTQTLSNPADWRDPSKVVRLETNAKMQFQFEIQARKPSLQSTEVVLRVQGEKYLIGRYRVSVTLPSPDPFQLTVLNGQEEATWLNLPDRLRLLPYPNQSTPYLLGLRNLTGKPAKLQVELLGLHAQPGANRFRWPFNAQGNLYPGEIPPERLSAVELTLAAGEAPQEIPFPLSPPPPPPPPGSDPNALPPLPSLSGGMALRVTDVATNRRWLKAIDVRAQHPRNYLRAIARYNNPAQRIEIELIKHPDRPMPTKGSIVSWPVGPEIDPNADLRTKGEIKITNGFRTQLFASVPSNPNKIVRVVLDVDDFPRAFIFEGRCGQTAELPQVEQPRPEVRIVAPDRRKKPAYRVVPDEETLIPVLVQVDAPSDVFQNSSVDDDAADGESDGPRRYLEVGLDENSDGFLPDDALRFFSDRMVKTEMEPIAKPGELSVAATVTDFKLDVPTHGLRNKKVNLVGHLELGPNTQGPRAYDTVEVVLDGTPPLVSIDPLRSVEKDKPIIATIKASDALTSVAKVEWAFSELKMDHFGKLEPLQATQVDGQPGVYTMRQNTFSLNENSIYYLLVRGTDAVGNQSRVEAMPVTITPKKFVPMPGDPAAVKALPNKVFGIVLFGGAPADRVTVTLVGSGQPPARTENGGKFSFKDVKPGKYTLKANGAVQNQFRSGETQVEVLPAPANPPAVVDVTLE